jgi:ABC-type glycerol-3-phosphate transport system permease component
MGIRRTLLKIVDHRATPYVILSVLAAFMLSPFIWMVLTAFKTLSETLRCPPTYFPENFTLKTLHQAWLEAPLATYLTNSLIMCLTATMVVVITASLTAFALSQYPYKGSNVVLGLFLFTRAIPPLAMLLPYYLLLMKLRLLDTRLSVILYLIYLSYPLVVWLLKGLFDTFPRELIDSGIADGCSRTGTLLRIVMPVTASGICAIAVIAFLWAWNEFVAPFLFMHSAELKPISVGIYAYAGDEIITYNFMCAAGIYAVIPSLLFFLLVQKYIIKGLRGGSLEF